MAPFGLVPYVLLGSLFRIRMARGGAFRALVSGLSEPMGPVELRDEVAKALGDPTVKLAYWVPDAGGFVDVEGNPVEVPSAGSNRAMTEVRAEDRLVAAIEHDSSLLDDLDHVQGVGAAAALALENQRLEAELRAKVQELRASRTRIVEEASAERRRLERDLHDGAQQRLVSLALNLRVAEGRIAEDPKVAKELLHAAGGELEEALGELRELARGIHPAVLTDRGLDAALSSLAARAPLPVDLETSLDGRLPEAVELTAYFVVAEALTNVARYADAERAKVHAVHNAGRLTIEVSDDGIGGPIPRGARACGVLPIGSRPSTGRSRCEASTAAAPSCARRSPAVIGGDKALPSRVQPPVGF
jgi:signal transduction histidine kinase